MSKQDLIRQYIATYKELHGETMSLQREDIDRMTQKDLNKQIWEMKLEINNRAGKRE